MRTIRNKATGAEQNVETMAGIVAGEWDVVGEIPSSATGDLSLYRGNSEIIERVEAALVTSIKAEAERRKMAVLTPGGAKKTEYADKAAEVRTWHTLGGTLTGVLAVLGAINGAKMRATFPYAIADAAAFGDTVDKAIARFAGGMSASATVPTIAALEAKACAAIKAATTSAAKRAAFAATTWS